MIPFRFMVVLAALSAAGSAPQAEIPNCGRGDGPSVIESRSAEHECRRSTGITVLDSLDRSYVLKVRTPRVAGRAAVGLTFGLTEPDAKGAVSGFTFAVDQDRDYRLFYRRGQETIPLIDWSRSPAIRTGAGSENTLTVVTTGGLIRCFINGEYVGGHRTTTALSGRLSFYAAGVVRAEFYELAVIPDPTTPPGTPTAGRIVVDDDLMSSRTLQVGGGSVCRTAYGTDGYVVRNVAARGICDLPLVSLGIFGSQIRVEVDVALSAGPLDHGVGVFVGRPFGAANPMYLGAIDGQGTFQFARRDGAWQRLTPVRLHDAVRRGRGVWNRLAIEIRGQTLRGFVNGRLTGRADASAAVAGLIGFYLDAPGMVAVFRNLTITEL